MSNKKSNAFDIESVIERIYKVIGSRTVKDVAEALHVSGQATSNWRTRNRIPWEKLFVFTQENAVSFEWLMTGVGEKGIVDPSNVTDTLETELVAQKEIKSIYSDHVQLQKETIIALKETITTQKEEIESLTRKIEELQTFIDSLQAKHCENSKKPQNSGNNNPSDANLPDPKRKAS